MVEPGMRVDWCESWSSVVSEWSSRCTTWSSSDCATWYSASDACSLAPERVDCSVGVQDMV